MMRQALQNWFGRSARPASDHNGGADIEDQQPQLQCPQPELLKRPQLQHPPKDYLDLGDSDAALILAATADDDQQKKINLRQEFSGAFPGLTPPERPSSSQTTQASGSCPDSEASPSAAGSCPDGDAAPSANGGGIAAPSAASAPDRNGTGSSNNTGRTTTSQQEPVHMSLRQWLLTCGDMAQACYDATDCDSASEGLGTSIYASDGQTKVKELQRILMDSVPANSPAAKEWKVRGEFFGTAGAYNLSGTNPSWVFRQIAKVWHHNNLKTKKQNFIGFWATREVGDQAVDVVFAWRGTALGEEWTSNWLYALVPWLSDMDGQPPSAASGWWARMWPFFHWLPYLSLYLPCRRVPRVHCGFQQMYSEMAAARKDGAAHADDSPHPLPDQPSFAARPSPSSDGASSMSSSSAQQLADSSQRHLSRSPTLHEAACSAAAQQAEREAAERDAEARQAEDFEKAEITREQLLADRPGLTWQQASGCSCCGSTPDGAAGSSCRPFEACSGHGSGANSGAACMENQASSGCCCGVKCCWSNGAAAAGAAAQPEPHEPQPEPRKQVHRVLKRLATGPGFQGRTIRKITVTGHSLGGALAVLAGCDIAEWIRSNRDASDAVCCQLSREGTVEEEAAEQASRSTSAGGGSSSAGVGTSGSSSSRREGNISSGNSSSSNRSSQQQHMRRQPSPPGSKWKFTTVGVITFAAPRVGDWLFSKKLQKLGVDVLRVVNKRDLVPVSSSLLTAVMNSCIILLLKMDPTRWAAWLCRWLVQVCTLFLFPWFAYADAGLELLLDSRLNTYLNPQAGAIIVAHTLENYLWCVAAQFRPGFTSWQRAHTRVRIELWPIFWGVVGALAAALVGPYLSWGQMLHDLEAAASTLGFALGGAAMGLAVGCCSIVGFVLGAESPHVKCGHCCNVCCGIALAALFVLASPAFAALGVVVIIVPLAWACCITMPCWLVVRLWKLRPWLRVQRGDREQPQQPTVYEERRKAFRITGRDFALLNKRDALLHPELCIPSSFWMKPARAMVEKGAGSMRLHPGAEDAMDPGEQRDGRLCQLFNHHEDRRLRRSHSANGRTLRPHPYAPVIFTAYRPPGRDEEAEDRGEMTSYWGECPPGCQVFSIPHCGFECVHAARDALIQMALEIKNEWNGGQTGWIMPYYRQAISAARRLDYLEPDVTIWWPMNGVFYVHRSSMQQHQSGNGVTENGDAVTQSEPPGGGGAEQPSCSS